MTNQNQKLNKLKKQNKKNTSLETESKANRTKNRIKKLNQKVSPYPKIQQSDKQSLSWLKLLDVFYISAATETYERQSQELIKTTQT